MTPNTRNPIKFYTVEYPNQGELKGVIYFVPGYGEYCDLYGNYFREFAASGFRVFSSGKRGFVKAKDKEGKLAIIWHKIFLHLLT